MTKKSRAPVIRLRGVRHNNLKNFDLDLPTRELIVITGLSGSGKSSLAFDTLFAEGQRRYIETFSPYARQFFDRMDKPQVDRIEGIPPAVAIEQRNSVRTTRSTVGTMTELCDYMKVLWPHLARLYCRQCGQPVRKDTPQVIWEDVLARSAKTAGQLLITFDLSLSDKLTLAESLALVSKQGYQRLLVDQTVVRLDEALKRLEEATSLTVIQDRLKAAPANRARFAEACEHAYHFGKGRLMVHWTTDGPFRVLDRALYSSGFHCASCDIAYREPVPALFSFNHPVGACPACRGFGRIITIDYNLAIPDRSRTLSGGAIKPWQTGQGAECQRDMARMCREMDIPMNVPFARLSAQHQDWIINGDPDYGKDEEHEWPRAWYGIKGYFRWLESKAYKMHVRVLLSRYRAYSTCPDCAGARFQPETLLYKLPTNEGLITLAEFYQRPIERALDLVDRLSVKAGPVEVPLGEARSRLRYLLDVGLGYLTLDRPTRSLSGGETERVNLTTCLGTKLVNTLYVLDEPSVGLHARDTARLVRILEALRDAGNTVVVVEHEASVMRAADRIVDLGPGHGESGGEVVCNGTYGELRKCRRSLTGQYLSGARSVPIPQRRPVDDTTPRLRIEGASRHNLKNVSIDIPLGRFVCLTGVSGSGKTTLAREVLLPQLTATLGQAARPGSASEPEESNAESAPSGVLAASSGQLGGYESLQQVVLVDQSGLGRTPRSNPAVYIGAFDSIRELFAQNDLARRRGLGPSAFSFNSTQGQCERCRGAGFEKIEMQFLSDVFIRCPDCKGRRYRPHILEVKLKASLPDQPVSDWSIADLLDATVDTAIQVLVSFAYLPAGRRALARLKLLQDVGLGYIQLGQPINTLSGGESQRLKLTRHLAEITEAGFAECGPALFVLDEPTTGLHFEDVRILLNALQRLVETGNSLLVIEHNLDVIKCADWVIDLGPEAGDRGGELVAQGTPEQVAECSESHTGAALRTVLPNQEPVPATV